MLRVNFYRKSSYGRCYTLLRSSHEQGKDQFRRKSNSGRTSWCTLLNRGTNFIGAKTELGEAASELNQKKVEKFVMEYGCKWQFNPPHTSLFGGVCERQFNTIRRAIDDLFAELGKTHLTH